MSKRSDIPSLRRKSITYSHYTRVVRRKLFGFIRHKMVGEIEIGSRGRSFSRSLSEQDVRALSHEKTPLLNNWCCEVEMQVEMEETGVDDQEGDGDEDGDEDGYYRSVSSQALSAEEAEWHKNTFAQDNRVIDLVLAYRNNNEKDLQTREMFLNELVERFELELEWHEADEQINGYGSIIREDEEQNSKIYFIKVHAPMEVLYDVAEELQLKMPTKLNDINIKVTGYLIPDFVG